MEKRSWLSRHRTFVPKDMLCGVLINEVIRRVCGTLLILLLLFISSYTVNTCMLRSESFLILSHASSLSRIYSFTSRSTLVVRMLYHTWALPTTSTSTFFRITSKPRGTRCAILTPILLRPLISQHGVEDCLVVLRGQNGPRQAPEQIFPVFPVSAPVTCCPCECTRHACSTKEAPPIASLSRSGTSQ